MSPEQVRRSLLDAMRVESFYPPADSAMLMAAESRLGIAFPQWLHELYLACNGFRGPTQWQYLFPLDGREGLVEFTEFMRSEDWAPSWLARAAIFGSDTGSGTLTTYFVVLDGSLITWTLGDGPEFRVCDGNVFSLFRREQQFWDDVGE